MLQIKQQKLFLILITVVLFNVKYNLYQGLVKKLNERTYTKKYNWYYKLNDIILNFLELYCY